MGSTSSIFSEVAEDRAPSTFQDNFVRLLGLHGLSQHFTAQLLGVSEATMSAWMNGKSHSVAREGDRHRRALPDLDRSLMGAEFSELLANELADPERFERVEKRIKRGGTKLTSV